MKLSDYFKETCKGFELALSKLEECPQHLNLLEETILGLPSERIFITYEPKFEAKARHLWEELVGKYREPRPPVPAVLFPILEAPTLDQGDISIHFGAPKTQPIGSTLSLLSISISTHGASDWHLRGEGKILELLAPHFGTLSWLVHLICEAFEPNPRKNIKEILRETQEAVRATFYCSKLEKSLCKLEIELTTRLAEGGLLFLAGNGGSACDTLDIGPSANVVSLLESGYLTCVANDYGYDSVFSRCVETLRSNKDIFIGLSTSGRSANIINALKMAGERNVFSLFLGANNSSQAGELASLALEVNASKTERIQELHAIVLYCLGTWIRKNKTS
jgi:D-sedoheptulose 7-phosphate isomerase